MVLGEENILEEASRSVVTVPSTASKTYTTEAICLKAIDFGEADKIVHLYSPEYGKISAIIKGAKKAKSKLTGAAELLSLSQVHLSRGKNLDVLVQYQSLDPFLHIRSDLLKLAFALLFAELVNLLAAEHDHDSEAIYFLLKNTLMHLEQSVVMPVATHFQVELLNTAGYQPVFTTCVLTGESLDLSRPYYPFSAELGGPTLPEQARQYPATKWVNVSTSTLNALNHPLGPVWEGVDALKTQKFLRYYFSEKLERTIHAYDFVLELLGTGK